MKEKVIPGEMRDVQPQARSVGLPLRVNFSWTLIGNIIYNACQWGMLIFIAKLGSAELVGRFTLGLAISAPVITLANLHLRAIQATDAAGEFSFNYYFALRLITSGLALLVITGIAVLSAFDRQFKLILIVIGIAKVIESISDILFGLIQQHEFMKLIGLSSIFRGILSLSALGGGLYWGGNLLWGVSLMALMWALILAMYDLPNGVALLSGYGQHKKISIFGKKGSLALIKPHFNFIKLKRLAWMALPLGVGISINSLCANIPRYFIGYYLGERELGIFAAISYSLVAAITVIQALGHSASPRLAKYFVSGNLKAFQKLLVNLFAIIVGLGGVGLLAIWGFGREFLTLAYRPEFGLHQNLFMLLGVGTIFGYMQVVLVAGITVARYFRIQLVINIIGILATTGACFILIPRFGLMGAGWARILQLNLETLLCFAVIFYIIHVRKKQLA